ncbi:MAG: CsbD family protein, partial [Chloroflexota bacterium]
MSDRIEELTGRVKEGVGRITGDEELEAEGNAQAKVARADRKVKGAKLEAG